MSVQSDNLKRNSIVSKGRELFWKFGLKKVSVEEICREASVSKMTFYKHFSNKKDLATHILTLLSEQAFSTFEEMLKKDLSYKEKLEYIMHAKLSYADNMSNEFFKDVWSDHNSPLFNLIEKMQVRSQQFFTDFLKEGQRNGDVRKDLNVEFVLDYTNSILSLSEDENFITKYGSVQELTKEIMNFMFYGISQR